MEQKDWTSGEAHPKAGAGRELSPWLKTRLFKSTRLSAQPPLSHQSVITRVKRKTRPIDGASNNRAIPGHGGLTSRAASAITLSNTLSILGHTPASIRSIWRKIDFQWLQNQRQGWSGASSAPRKEQYSDLMKRGSQLLQRVSKDRGNDTHSQIPNQPDTASAEKGQPAVTKPQVQVSRARMLGHEITEINRTDNSLNLPEHRKVTGNSSRFSGGQTASVPAVQKAVTHSGSNNEIPYKAEIPNSAAPSTQISRKGTTDKKTPPSTILKTVTVNRSPKPASDISEAAQKSNNQPRNAGELSRNTFAPETTNRDSGSNHSWQDERKAMPAPDQQTGSSVESGSLVSPKTLKTDQSPDNKMEQSHDNKGVLANRNKITTDKPANKASEGTELKLKRSGSVRSTVFQPLSLPDTSPTNNLETKKPATLPKSGQSNPEQSQTVSSRPTLSSNSNSANNNNSRIMRTKVYPTTNVNSKSESIESAESPSTQLIQKTVSVTPSVNSEIAPASSSDITMQISSHGTADNGVSGNSSGKIGRRSNLEINPGASTKPSVARTSKDTGLSRSMKLTAAKATAPTGSLNSSSQISDSQPLSTIKSETPATSGLSSAVNDNSRNIKSSVHPAKTVYSSIEKPEPIEGPSNQLIQTTDHITSSPNEGIAQADSLKITSQIGDRGTVDNSVPSFNSGKINRKSNPETMIEQSIPETSKDPRSPHKMKLKVKVTTPTGSLNSSTRLSVSQPLSTLASNKPEPSGLTGAVINKSRGIKEDGYPTKTVYSNSENSEPAEATSIQLVRKTDHISASVNRDIAPEAYLSRTRPIDNRVTTEKPLSRQTFTDNINRKSKSELKPETELESSVAGTSKDTTLSRSMKLTAAKTITPTVTLNSSSRVSDSPLASALASEMPAPVNFASLTSPAINEAVITRYTEEHSENDGQGLPDSVVNTNHENDTPSKPSGRSTDFRRAISNPSFDGTHSASFSLVSGARVNDIQSLPDNNSAISSTNNQTAENIKTPRAFMSRQPGILRKSASIVLANNPVTRIESSAEEPLSRTESATVVYTKRQTQFTDVSKQPISGEIGQITGIGPTEVAEKRLRSSLSPDSADSRISSEAGSGSKVAPIHRSIKPLASLPISNFKNNQGVLSNPNSGYLTGKGISFPGFLDLPVANSASKKSSFVAAGNDYVSRSPSVVSLPTTISGNSNTSAQRAVPTNQTVAGAVAAAPAAEQEERGNSTDLKKLAREIYPLIKRMILLDIERKPL